jgi:hypothetical protein
VFVYCVCCVGCADSCLCDELITRLDESWGGLTVRNVEIAAMWRPGRYLGCSATHTKQPADITCNLCSHFNKYSSVKLKL